MTQLCLLLEYNRRGSFGLSFGHVDILYLRLSPFQRAGTSGVGLFPKEGEVESDLGSDSALGRCLLLLRPTNTAKSSSPGPQDDLRADAKSIFDSASETHEST